MKKHYTEWQDNYGCERRDFEDYATDVLGWSPYFARGADGKYLDKTTECLFVMWFDGWGNGFDRGHYCGMTKALTLVDTTPVDGTLQGIPVRHITQGE